MTPWDTCSLCPRLCRTACPVATGSGREAAVPTWIAWVARAGSRGDVPGADVAQAITLCTDCGACRTHCHLDQPLPDRLRELRARVLPAPELAPLEEIEGDGAWVAVESDPRAWGSALAQHTGRAVRRWRTSDHLGVAAVDHPVFVHRAARLRQWVGELEVVVSGGGAALALERAEIPFTWLHDRVPEIRGEALGSCRAGGERPLACCGAAEPLASHHPADADRVGRMFLERAGIPRLLDTRCSAHLRGCGGAVDDVVDRLFDLIRG